MNHRTALLLARHAALKQLDPRKRVRQARLHRRVWNATPWHKRHELRQAIAAEIEELS